MKQNTKAKIAIVVAVVIIAGVFYTLIRDLTAPAPVDQPATTTAMTVSTQTPVIKSCAPNEQLSDLCSCGGVARITATSTICVDRKG